MTLVARINTALTAVATDIKSLMGRVLALEAGGPIGGIGSITTTISGSINMPYTGTARRYSAFNRTFQVITVGVSVPPVTAVNVIINKNGVPAATIQLPAGETYVTGAIDFSMVPGDYLTTDMNGGTTSNVVISLD